MCLPTAIHNLFPSLKTLPSDARGPFSFRTIADLVGVGMQPNLEAADLLEGGEFLIHHGLHAAGLRAKGEFVEVLDINKEEVHVSVTTTLIHFLAKRPSASLSKHCTVL